ncbi:ferredoxin--NADP reductase [Nocardia sp. NPDC052112]|uniref:ferredoxin--NADP reductase n=1 Tax=Nocardia sp. NPDC052112 TaxID=3155646 RepID=UPI0034207CE2
MTHTIPRLLGHPVGVRRVIDETPDTKSIVLDIPPELQEKFSYRPGQFLTVRIPSARTGSVARCYSLASSPHTDDELKVTVKRTADGYGSNWLCDNIVEGAQLHVLPPSGTFTPGDLTDDFLLFAAGSGITPVISILKSVLAQSKSHVALFYANRDDQSVIFDAELHRLRDTADGRLSVEHWLETDRGLPNATGLAEFARRFPGRDAYLCGPAPFMAAVRNMLSDIGMDRSRIHAEEFSSLSGDPFAPAAPLAATGNASTVVVRLDGESHTLSWPPTANLVDVLLDAGIDAPFSCREGECGSCMCALTAGTVDLGRIDALDPDDVVDGYILACQARPTSPTLEVDF